MWRAAFPVLAACSVDAYHLSFERDGGGPPPDGGGGDVVTVRLDAGPADAEPPDGCNARPEYCNGEDDDCDLVVDDGFDLSADPENCGACGRTCLLLGSAGTCEAGECRFSCLSGYYDLDGVPGCEYRCIVTQGGAEVCDGEDNDCDGQLDEDVDLASDPENCGHCGNRCYALHSTAACSVGVCQFACETGYKDLRGDIGGCEYACPVFPETAESCDAEDDDCDGLIDDGNPGGGAACGVGECAGQMSCFFGTLACVGPLPTREVCDSKDNDCDGASDEDFDFSSDLATCGGCTPCPDLPHTIEACAAGRCTVFTCELGWVDLTAAPGCETACTRSGPEVCDGVDNDCDGLTDAVDPDMLVPGNFCVQASTCAGTQPTCGRTASDATVMWRCLYAPPVETDAEGNLLPNERVCDDVDGDCDGVPDDSFRNKGTACQDSGFGECRGTGHHVCAPGGADTMCLITDPGAVPVAEMCNGLDDDCDGSLDEGAPDDMVLVTSGGLRVLVDKYEASRPDATAASDGLLEHRACSLPGRVPWTSVSWGEAAAACAAAGKQLCTETEWREACEGAANTAYPYGTAYQPDWCNGRDHDSDCATPGDDSFVMPTGSPIGCPAPAATRCVSAHGAVDLSGNVKEWTRTQTQPSPPAYRVRGGAYDNVAPGLTCQFDFLSADDSYRFENLGFRCCKPAP